MACIHLPLEVFPDGSYKPINDSANITFDKCDVLPASSNLPSINLTEILSGFGAKPNITTEQEIMELLSPATTEQETTDLPSFATTEQETMELSSSTTTEQEPDIRVFVDPNKKRHHSRNLTFRKSKRTHNHTRKHYDDTGNIERPVNKI